VLGSVLADVAGPMRNHEALERAALLLPRLDTIRFLLLPVALGNGSEGASDLADLRDHLAQVDTFRRWLGFDYCHRCHVAIEASGLDVVPCEKPVQRRRGVGRNLNNSLRRQLTRCAELVNSAAIACSFICSTIFVREPAAFVRRVERSRRRLHGRGAARHFRAIAWVVLGAGQGGAVTARELPSARAVMEGDVRLIALRLVLHGAA
jgi:hypothetical protein